jgi:hypothetical protein
MIFLIVLAKEWQQQLHQDDRSRSVKQIVLNLLDIVQRDKKSLSSNHLNAIEKRAQEIEAAVFNAAKSFEDYSQRVIRCIKKIQEANVTKQMLKKQGIATGTLSEHVDNDHTASDGISRCTIYSYNSNTNTGTNGSHIDTMLTETENISPSHDTKTQVRIYHYFNYDYQGRSQKFAKKSAHQQKKTLTFANSVFSPVLPFQIFFVQGVVRASPGYAPDGYEMLYSI